MFTIAPSLIGDTPFKSDGKPVSDIAEELRKIDETAAQDRLREIRAGFEAGGVEYLLREMARLHVENQKLRVLYERVAIGETSRKLQAIERAMAVMGGLGVDTVAALVDTIHIDAEMALDPADGFHHIEYNADGMPFRWTGPAPDFHFILFLDRRKPRALSLNICDFSLRDEQAVSAWVDGARTPWTQTRAHGGLMAHRVRLPAREGGAPTLVRFGVRTLHAPAHHDPDSTDDRHLGVAFHSLQVSPDGDALEDGDLVDEAASLDFEG